MNSEWIRNELTEYLPAHEVEELAQILMYKAAEDRRKAGAIGLITGILITLLILG